MITVVRPAPAPRFNVLRTIAVYKLVKVLLLLALAYGEVRLRDASLAAKLVIWASARAVNRKPVDLLVVGSAPAIWLIAMISGSLLLSCSFPAEVKTRSWAGPPTGCASPCS